MDESMSEVKPEAETEPTLIGFGPEANVKGMTVVDVKSVAVVSP